MMRKTTTAKLCLGSFLGLLFCGLAQAARDWNLQTPVTPVAQEIFDLHTIIVAICCVIFVIVFGVMFYSIYHHRKSKGHKAAQFHENTKAEVIWTVIPFFILIGMALPATKTILDMKDSSAADLTIKVTGYQWKWGYDYIHEGFNFVSTLKTPYQQIYNLEEKGPNYLLEVDNPMVVPVGKKVRLLITAADVLHAWWVPAFGVKQDAIPGFVRDSWFKADQPGIYRGQCAELCGKEHGFMPIVVEVKSAQDYAAWVTAHKQKAAAAADDPNRTWELKDLLTRGEKVYSAQCVACHQANGQGVPNAFPSLIGAKAITGPKAEQVAILLNGRPGTAMQSFKQLSDVEIAAVIAYTRNSWNNQSTDIAQPAEIKAARK